MRLRDYQAEACELNIKNNVRAIGFTQGGGKSLTVKAIIEDLIYYNCAKNILLLAPCNVIIDTWADMFPDLNVLNLNNLTGKEFNFNKDYDVIIIPHTKLTTFTQKLFAQCGKKKTITAMIVDESTYYRGTNSKRTASIFVLLRRYNIIYRTILSGDFLVKDLMDCYTQFNILYKFRPGADVDNYIGVNKITFNNNYGRPEMYQAGSVLRERTTYNNDGVNKFVDLIAKDTSYLDRETLQKYVLKETGFGGGVETPTDIDYFIDLDEKTKKIYNTFKNKAVIDLGKVALLTKSELANYKPDVFTLLNSTSSIKLRQLLSGFIYYTEEDEVLNNIPLGDIGDSTTKVQRIPLITGKRLDAVEAIRTRMNKGNALILVNFKEDFKIIQDRYPEAVILTSKAIATTNVIQDWNNGKINILLANPASVSHGLNLQFGGNYYIWWSLCYSYDLYAQVLIRLARIGQDKKVTNFRIIVKGTVEESSVTTTLATSMGNASYFKNALGERIKFNKQESKNEQNK